MEKRKLKKERNENKTKRNNWIDTRHGRGSRRRKHKTRRESYSERARGSCRKRKRLRGKDFKRKQEKQKENKKGEKKGRNKGRKKQGKIEERKLRLAVALSRKMYCDVLSHFIFGYVNGKKLLRVMLCCIALCYDVLYLYMLWCRMRYAIWCCGKTYNIIKQHSVTEPIGTEQNIR